MTRRVVSFTGTPGPRRARAASRRRAAGARVNRAPAHTARLPARRALSGRQARVEDVEHDLGRAVVLGLVHDDVLALVGHGLAAGRLHAQRVAAVLDRQIARLADLE